jgi:hypothetical protein
MKEVFSQKRRFGGKGDDVNQKLQYHCSRLTQEKKIGPRWISIPYSTGKIALVELYLI